MFRRQFKKNYINPIILTKVISFLKIAAKFLKNLAVIFCPFKSMYYFYTAMALLANVKNNTMALFLRIHLYRHGAILEFSRMAPWRC